LYPLTSLLSTGIAVATLSCIVVIRRSSADRTILITMLLISISYLVLLCLLLFKFYSQFKYSRGDILFLTGDLPLSVNVIIDTAIVTGAYAVALLLGIAGLIQWNRTKRG